MEWFFRYNIVLLLVASVCLLQVDCIVFEINNIDVNRVVYIFESDIKMTCSEPPNYISNPQFEILHNSSPVNETQNLKITRERRSAELTISQVQLMDGGEYTCRVRSRGSTEVLTAASLTLNVQAGGAYCLHNDSSLKWNEGETKTLSCYYAFSSPVSSSGGEFQWQVLNSSSFTFPLISSSLYNDSVYKRILFASIGPLKSSDNGNVYQCVHSTDYLADISASCMFGPITVNPKVLTTTVTADDTNPLSTGSMFQTKSTAHNTSLVTIVVQSSPVNPQTALTPSSTNVTTTTEETSLISMLVPVIIAVACAVIVVSCLICLIVICKCRGRNNKKENDSEMVTNEVYDPFDGYMKPDVKVLSTEETTRPMAGSNGGVVTEIPWDEHNQVDKTYDKVDHNKERLNNKRTPPVAAVRSSLLLNDSDYDKLDHSKVKTHGHIKAPMAAARGTLVDKKLSDEKHDVRYDTVTKDVSKVKGNEKSSNDTKFQKADVVYDKVNTKFDGLERKKEKIVAKMGDTYKANANLDVQELYAKIDKTRSLERSKAKMKDKGDAVLY